MELHGEGQWAIISQHLNKAFGKSEDQGRIGKQCREVSYRADSALKQLPALYSTPYNTLCYVLLASMSSRTTLCINHPTSSCMHTCPFPSLHKRHHQHDMHTQYSNLSKQPAKSISSTSSIMSFGRLSMQATPGAAVLQLSAHCRDPCLPVFADLPSTCLS